MPESVVDRLEIVEVAEQHGDWSQVAQVQVQCVFGAVDEQRPVGQAGELIVKSLLMQLLLPRSDDSKQCSVLAHGEVLARQHHREGN